MAIDHDVVQVAADGTGKKIGNIKQTDGDGVEVYVQKTTTWDPEDGTDTGGWKIDSNAGRTGSVDGGHATIGTTTDAEASSGDGTLVALLKRLRTLLGGGLPAALGAGGGVKVDGSAVTQPVGEVPVTSGGLSVYSFLSTAAVQAAQIKGSAGQVYGLHCFNNSALIAYGRLYNQTGAPVAGDSANIVYRFMVPANTSAAGVVIPIPSGFAFATGIGIRVSGGVADADTTVLPANAVMGNALYK